MPVNLMGFAANSSLISPAEALSFPSTINAFSYFRGLVTEFRIPPILGYLLKFIVYIYLIKVILLIYKEKLEFDSLAFFSIIFITNYSTSTGGYGLLYYVPALALLYKKRNWVNLAIIVIAMYIGVWDLIPIYHFGDVNQNVFLSDENILITNYVGFGSLLRPIANFVLLVLFYKNLKKRYLYAFV
jgi:hypothetical protein